MMQSSNNIYGGGGTDENNDGARTISLSADEEEAIFQKKITVTRRVSGKEEEFFSTPTTVEQKKRKLEEEQQANSPSKNIGKQSPPQSAPILLANSSSSSNNNEKKKQNREVLKKNQQQQRSYPPEDTRKQFVQQTAANFPFSNNINVATMLQQQAQIQFYQSLLEQQQSIIEQQKQLLASFVEQKAGLLELQEAGLRRDQEEVLLKARRQRLEQIDDTMFYDKLQREMLEQREASEDRAAIRARRNRSAIADEAEEGLRRSQANQLSTFHTLQTIKAAEDLRDNLRNERERNANEHERNSRLQDDVQRAHLREDCGDRQLNREKSLIAMNQSFVREQIMLASQNNLYSASFEFAADGKK